MTQNKTFVLGTLVVPIALLGLAIAYAGSASTPNTFVAGQPAVAADVNENFAAHKAAIDDNDARISALKTRHMAVQNAINGAAWAGNPPPQDWISFVMRDVGAADIDLAGRPYRFKFTAFIQEGVDFAAPDTPGDISLQLVFHPGTAAEVAESFVVTLGAAPGPASATVTGTYPAPPDGPLAHLPFATRYVRVRVVATTMDFSDPNIMQFAGTLEIGE